LEARIGTQKKRDSSTHKFLKQLRLAGPLVAVGDMHEPWASKSWKRWVVQQIKDRQPAYVVQMGDAYDYYCFSKFARSFSVLTPRQELRTGRLQMEDFWGEVAAAAPRARRIQLLGNHDARAIKRVLDTLPELEELVDWQARHTFNGVETHFDEKDELILGRLFLHHGHKKHGAHARWNQASTVVAHLHTGGVVYYQNRSGLYFELNAGYGANPDAPPLRYRYQKKIHGWTQGLGAVDEDGPKFVIYPGG
jgi:hypothetical protein